MSRPLSIDVSAQRVARPACCHVGKVACPLSRLQCVRIVSVRRRRCPGQPAALPGDRKCREQERDRDRDREGESCRVCRNFALK